VLPQSTVGGSTSTPFSKSTCAPLWAYNQDAGDPFIEWVKSKLGFNPCYLVLRKEIDVIEIIGREEPSADDSSKEHTLAPREDLAGELSWVNFAVTSEDKEQAFKWAEIASSQRGSC